MARVVHFEIPADDPDRAVGFYGNVFGWTFNQITDSWRWICGLWPGS